MIYISLGVGFVIIKINITGEKVTTAGIKKY